jgi:hypothetical protein
MPTYDSVAVDSLESRDQAESLAKPAVLSVIAISADSTTAKALLLRMREKALIKNVTSFSSTPVLAFGLCALVAKLFVSSAS